ncbi:hypothetical protein [Tabrizicola sp.]|uniref:hypothetical protein n=1 Tax=Tabrizicola sp. TaxID=2005166 RepID=UPI003F32131B
MPFIVIGMVVTVLAGVLSRYLGAIWGLALPVFIVVYTIAAANMEVHPEGRMGQGMLVMFILLPYCAATLIGYGVGLLIRRRSMRARL